MLPAILASNAIMNQICRPQTRSTLSQERRRSSSCHHMPARETISQSPGEASASTQIVYAGVPVAVATGKVCMYYVDDCSRFASSELSVSGLAAALSAQHGRLQILRHEQHSFSFFFIKSNQNQPRPLFASSTAMRCHVSKTAVLEIELFHDI